MIIKKELNNININSIYSSNKNSIYDTIDAHELLFILKSILYPTNKNFMNQASITHIFQKILSHNIITKDEKKYYIMQKLYFYHEIWNKNGIFHMIRKIVIDYQSNTNYFIQKKYHKKNINFLHLAELLQNQCQNIFKKTYLIRWFENKIHQKNNTSNIEKIRILNHELNAVNITTIHKSKGLEYPITWIPFLINFHETKLSLYHKKNLKIFFDLNSNNNNFQIAEKERLAEDIRFLYVALTRSIVHCSIGIASLIKDKNKKNNNHSDIHKSALGYIIQNGHSMNYEQLKNQLIQLNKKNCIEIYNETIKSNISISNDSIEIIKEYNLYNKKKHDIWSITSFTKLNLENSLYTYNQHLKLQEKELIPYNISNTQKLNTYNFPKGKNTGKLIHNILKNINFKKKINYEECYQKIQKYQINKKWISILLNWINSIIDTPITEKNIILSKLKKTEYIQELEFFLPIKKKLSSDKLNDIIQSLDPISHISPKLSFNSMHGFLRGFIDLFFIWKNKYYIIDYKSNWLGDNNNFYSPENITKEIIKHRYDLQYQIYTIAIHQYLKKKIKKYHYNTHFGGIFYIFIRAINHKNKKNGIFYTIPNYNLIKKIIAVFFE